MGWGQALDHFLALIGKGEEDLAAVIGCHLADDGLAEDELIHDAHGTVMANLQLLRKITYGELAPRGGGADGQESLVLVRGEVFLAEQVLTESQEFANLITERSEGFKIGGVHRSNHDA